jgi:hypothetical protein
LFLCFVAGLVVPDVIFYIKEIEPINVLCFTGIKVIGCGITAVCAFTTNCHMNSKAIMQIVFL